MNDIPKPDGQSSPAEKQTLGFQTEVRQLLQLMIHSLYGNREIFLRELISNASDACDKLRFEALDSPGLLEDDAELAIRIEFDREARIIRIIDNGVGMSREEAVSNLGTIARSGTREFFGQLSGDQARDAQLIGQFGVGFYSAFIVAERVVVLSRRAGAQAGEGVRWESDGSGEFTVESIERPQRGTEVVLHLRPAGNEADVESTDALLNGWRLRSIVRKYSDHVSLPIRMRKEKPAAKDEPVDDTEEWETVNQASALWSRSKSELADEDYKAFYRNLGLDGADPLAWTHNRVEGRTEYTQLLFIPSKAPFDIWDREHRHGIKLYVRRVFIMDDAQQLLPAYLRFVRGVIDSADLPLNVSREILQESRDVKAIREGSTRRVLGMLEELASGKPDDYAAFWSEFGQVLKEGVGEDFGNRERLLPLLRFASTMSEGDAQTVSFADYVGRMKEGQEKIYYLTAESLAAARNSPHLELFARKGVEVLLMVDRVDEWMLGFLGEFDGKPLVSVARGDLELDGLADEEEKAQAEQSAEEHKELLGKLREALGERVKEVRVTRRLTESASCLVSDEGDISAHLERLLRQAGQNAPQRKPILEINPDHALVARIRAGDAGIEDWAMLLFEQALLAEGGQLEDPAGFVRRVNRMLLGQ
ncbi:MAG: molecular chaperone HtpG [Burkholderiaceae bacterium]|nr:molecular chaperone HtpG [Burkholderiaceae bacterium]